MKNHMGRLLIAAFGLTLASCGNLVLDTQSGTKDNVKNEVTGAWGSPCQDKETLHINIDAERLSYSKVTYFDPECQEPIRTITHGGAYKLAHTFKTGVLDAMVFTADPMIYVTLHTDDDTENMNNALADVQNEDLAQVTKDMPVSQKRQLIRGNKQIVETRKLRSFARGQSKELNRLQYEKLNKKGLGAAWLLEFAGRRAYQYQIDNGFLQTAVAPGKVFTK